MDSYLRTWTRGRAAPKSAEREATSFWRRLCQALAAAGSQSSVRRPSACVRFGDRNESAPNNLAQLRPKNSPSPRVPLSRTFLEARKPTQQPTAASERWCVGETLPSLPPPPILPPCTQPASHKCAPPPPGDQEEQAVEENRGLEEGADGNRTAGSRGADIYATSAHGWTDAPREHAPASRHRGSLVEHRRGVSAARWPCLPEF
jgi:hypothetical protein